MEGDPDVSLMLRVQAGDEEAFARLLSKYERPISRLIFRYLGRAADLQDLTQEVFLRVYRARATWRPQPSFRSWLYRIATNLCLNQMRGRKITQSLDVGSEDGTGPSVADPRVKEPGELLEKKELSLVIQEILDDLPASQKMAVMLNKYQGLAYQEIGEAMGLSIPAVKSLLSRARERIKERLLPYLRSGKGHWKGM
ncbi:MAG: sigma-70 family RNA polymerase sigma factor [Planctomycetota bacterium]|nr:sigma-70 family RNA polymerase sigma factor [Planctomycetota bacterium]